MNYEYHLGRGRLYKHGPLPFTREGHAFSCHRNKKATQINQNMLYVSNASNASKLTAM